jgi:hypothetical protein
MKEEPRPYGERITADPSRLRKNPAFGCKQPERSGYCSCRAALIENIRDNFLFSEENITPI